MRVAVGEESWLWPLEEAALWVELVDAVREVAQKEVQDLVGARQNSVVGSIIVAQALHDGHLERLSAVRLEEAVGAVVSEAGLVGKERLELCEAETNPSGNTLRRITAQEHFIWVLRKRHEKHQLGDRKILDLVNKEMVDLDAVVTILLQRAELMED